MTLTFQQQVTAFMKTLHIKVAHVSAVAPDDISMWTWRYGDMFFSYDQAAFMYRQTLIARRDEFETTIKMVLGQPGSMVMPRSAGKAIEQLLSEHKAKLDQLIKEGEP